MSIDSPQQLLVLIQFNDVEKHEMDAEEESFFSLKKGESLTYKIVGSEDAPNSDTVSITTLVGSNVEVNQSDNPCKHKNGCTVTVTAKEDTSTVLTTTLEHEKVKEVSYLELKTNLTLTLH